LLLIFVLYHLQTARSDFVGPRAARHAMSPDGNWVVRITTAAVPAESAAPLRHEVAYYRFDRATDRYVRRAGFHLAGCLGAMMYVSNAGDLVLISLGEKRAIRLYSPKAGLMRSWDLDSFLGRREIKACARTGSTLQWFEEGAFHDRVFHFRGPSSVIRALGPSYTAMRGVSRTVSFSGSLDAATGKLSRQRVRRVAPEATAALLLTPFHSCSINISFGINLTRLPSRNGAFAESKQEGPCRRSTAGHMRTAPE
jgi:hypothetical protein